MLPEARARRTYNFVLLVYRGASQAVQSIPSQRQDGGVLATRLTVDPLVEAVIIRMRSRSLCALLAEHPELFRISACTLKASTIPLPTRMIYRLLTRLLRTQDRLPLALALLNLGRRLSTHLTVRVPVVGRSGSEQRKRDGNSRKSGGSEWRLAKWSERGTEDGNKSRCGYGLAGALGEERHAERD
jgi:hypothetical protein